MSNQKIQFKKVYARDNCLLIQEAWNKEYLTFDGIKNPHSTPIIFYINQGIVEIWENDKSINWFIDSLVQKNHDDKDFFKKSMIIYQDILAELDTYWKRDHLESVKELQHFFALMEKGTKYFMIFYYSGYDNRNPEHVKKAALKIRTADSYYDDSDKLLRNTLTHLYPYISYNLSLSILSSELITPPNKEDLEKRYINCVFIPNHNFEITTLDKFLDKNLNYIFTFDKIKINNNTFKGNVAFKGLAEGEVKILKHKSDIPNFKEGQILVSPMTTPVFLPAMKKAAAIITDEGGITCHAAVVAREFGVPCVIGTKTATQILKDGDIVRVDANKGIIYIK